MLYSLVHIKGSDHSLPHHPSTFLTPRLNFLIRSTVSVSSWTQISRSMLTSPRFAKPAIFISDHFDISDARSTDDMAILIAVALVQSRLDYCNSLFFNMSCFNINKLQRVQNLAARLALNDWRSSTQELFAKLHWLPIQPRIKFKIGTLVYKLLSTNQPANLRSLITSYVSPRLLRSSDQCLLSQPRTRTCIGQRVFSVCAPTVWNSLPLSIRLSPTLATFKRNLKTFYFATS